MGHCFHYLILLLSDESKGLYNGTARLTVLRDMGRFGDASVSWYVVDNNNNNTDLVPLSGTLTYTEGIGERDIVINAVADGVCISY